jgi:ribose transport system substrate-binding protein
MRERKGVGSGRRWLVACLLFAATALIGAGCGDDNDDGDSAGTSSGDVVAKAQDQVNQLTAEITEWPPPPEGPAPASGKKIAAVMADGTAEGAVRTADGIKQAAEALGWEVEILDGKGAPNTMISAMNQAISEQVDGILLIYIDENYVKPGIEAAHQQNIPVVSLLGGNKGGGGSGVDYDVASFDYARQTGEAGAWFTIADSDGKAKAIVVNDTSFVLGVERTKGQLDVLEQCGGCEVAEEVEFQVVDLTTKLPGQIQSALAANPDVDYILAPYDAAATFIAQGVQQAGRANDVKIVSADGNIANLDMVRNGGPEVALAANPLEWVGFVGVDDLNRIFQGEEPVPPEYPLKLLTAENLPPEGQAWTGDVDYVQLYKDHWGVK